MNPIRVILVDDHNLVRAGIRLLLQKLPDVEVAGEAGNAEEAMRLLAQKCPTVLVTDLSMPGVSGLSLLESALKLSPELRVLVLSMHTSEDYVLQSLRAGAAGYLVKDAATAELELAVRAVARGETYLSPAVSGYLIPTSVKPGAEPASREPLTPRQREILRLIAEGHSTKEIARLLEISGKTVETHRTQLMERLGIHDVAGLVRYALRIGLISP